MRIGVLGSGKMGVQHLAAIQSLLDITGVTRADAAFSNQQFASREQWYHHVIESPDIDAIDICLPTALHPELVIAGLQAGKHVLCEKPLALDLSGCRRVVDAVAGARSTFMVAHVLRFFPAYPFLAEVVRDQRFGSLKSLTLTRVSAIPNWAPWLQEPTQSGSAILDLLIHDFDQTVALFGMPERITASPIESHNTVRCELEYSPASGVTMPVVRIEGGWFADGRPFAMGYHASFAEAEVVFAEGTVSITRPGTLEAEIVELPKVDPYAEQMRAFADCCRRGTQPLDCTAEAGMRAVKLALAVRTASEVSPGAPRTISKLEEDLIALEG